MHPTALQNCQRFVAAYANGFAPDARTQVLEIGSQDVNGSLRTVCHPQWAYLGLDFVPGKGVDRVLDDPYVLPFPDASADIVISSSCFEHSAMFWLVYLEIMRVLKPAGLFYLNVPSNGDFHRYPVDCWRFYPDSGEALVTWGLRNGHDSVLLESYVSHQHQDMWNDFVGVFLKDRRHLAQHPRRILDQFADFRNGRRHGHEGFLKPQDRPEDRVKLQLIEQVLRNQIRLA